MSGESDEASCALLLVRPCRVWCCGGGEEWAERGAMAGEEREETSAPEAAAAAD